MWSCAVSFMTHNIQYLPKSSSFSRFQKQWISHWGNFQKIQSNYCWLTPPWNQHEFLQNPSKSPWISRVQCMNPIEPPWNHHFFMWLPWTAAPFHRRWNTRESRVLTSANGNAWRVENAWKMLGVSHGWSIKNPSNIGIAGGFNMV